MNDQNRRAERVLEVVSDIYGCSPEDLKGRSRLARYMWPRHVAAWAMREYGFLTLVEIGEALGGRDHSTIYNSVYCVPRRMAADPRERRAVDRVIEALAGGSIDGPEIQAFADATAALAATARIIADDLTRLERVTASLERSTAALAAAVGATQERRQQRHIA